MSIHIVLIIVSLVLLYLGAEGLVRGSASLAIRAGLSSLTVGLTIVAFGTSAPELVVSVKASLSGQGDISVGNVVGSNIFNTGFILGLTALLCPIMVHRQIIRFDAPINIAVSALLPILLINSVLGRIEGLFLFLGIIVYTAANVVLARKSKDEIVAEDAAKFKTRHWVLDPVYIIAGLAILVFGSRLLVDHSVIVAEQLGISKAVIGLTIVAVGTSLPELATSVVAAIRKQPDIALGNIVGSNIFNILAILGAASLCSPLVAPGVTLIDYGFMLAFSILLLPFLYTGKTLGRLEGAIIFAIYAVYIFILWPK